MRRPEIIPNFYAYELKVNNRQLTNDQKEHFFNCVNKLYIENDKFIYRGDKKDKLQSLYGVGDDEFYNSIFTMGAKAGMFVNHDLPYVNEIDIAEAGNKEFRLLFRMLRNLLNREFPFGATRMAMSRFRANEESVTCFFRESSNEQVLIDIVRSISEKEQLIVRDYYLALLHHISKSEYYPSSFLLSTTINFSQAHKFAWRNENADCNNLLILFGWVPKQYEGILSVPDSRILRRKIDMAALRLPVYERSFFYIQEEITLKGGLLPHYLLGYLHSNNGREVFEINSALFQINDSWNGIELPIDQGTFHKRIENTLYGRYFTLDDEIKYRQYNV